MPAVTPTRKRQALGATGEAALFTLHPCTELEHLVLDSHSSLPCPLCKTQPWLPRSLQSSPADGLRICRCPAALSWVTRADVFELGARAAWHRANPCVLLETAPMCPQVPHSKPWSTPAELGVWRQLAPLFLEAEHKLSLSDPKSLRRGPSGLFLLFHKQVLKSWRSGLSFHLHIFCLTFSTLNRYLWYPLSPFGFHLLPTWKFY